MKLVSVDLQRLAIPFRDEFRHARTTRRVSESVWVTARSRHGTRGRGEGCPRRYVTGESVESADAFLCRHRRTLIEEVTSVETLAAWTRRHRADIDTNPAAWCAIELALLDLAGRESGVPVESLLGLPAPGGRPWYSAVLGVDTREAFRRRLDAYRQAGFRDFKVKLSGDAVLDCGNLALLAEVPDARVRVDANNLWTSAAKATDYLGRLPVTLFAVEEPLTPGDIEGLQHVAIALDTRIVLDESLPRAAGLRELPHGISWIGNLRVSRVGGLMRSLELVEVAHELDMPLIVGAHVGETSLLTRAGLAVACAAGTLLVAREGAFGTRLLQYDVCDPPLQFGHAGELELPPPGAGLGLALRTAY